MGSETPDPAPAEIENPTRVRYEVLNFLCGLSFILYIDRICIAQAGPRIQEDLGLTETQMGVVFSAFTVAYGLFEIPTGRWGDRFGSRGVLTRIVLWWSAFTALTGCVGSFSLDSGYRVPLWGGREVSLLFNSFLLLVLIRFLFGAGEAGAYPNTARVLARWFPPGRRGFAQGLITTSALVGAAFAPVVAQKMIEVAGWRWAFVVFGSLGVVWAAAFHVRFRDDPAEHPGVNDAERRVIAAGRPPVAGEPHPPVPWRQVLASRNVWMLGGLITCTAFTSYVYYTWFPKYLQEARAVERGPSGWLASLVLAGGALGGMFGGYLGDWLVRRSGGRRDVRRYLAAAALTAAALALLSSLWCDAPLAATLCITLACFLANLMLPNWWAVVTDISGKHVGTLFGLMNSMGAVGAALSPLFFGIFVDYRKGSGFEGRARWDPGFYVYAGALVLAALGWLFVNPNRPVIEPRPAEAEP